MASKYIFVTGGVVSGLGKGITAASLGRLLKERGYKVTIQKFDPYINVDPGTMSPYQHGEVFVTEDGAETDLDLGHYERFIDENLSIDSSITSGKVYWTVLNKERNGDYLGGTVQVIPHITNEIKDRIHRVGVSCDADIVITEIGGTVGDIESLPFLEAIRQFITEVGRENAMCIHVTLVPTIPGSTELKSKPTQHSIKELLSLGIQPNIIVCRSELPIPDDMKQKISLFCSAREEDIIENLTVSSLYEAPIMLENEGLAKSVCHHLKLKNYETPPMEKWHQMLDCMAAASEDVLVGIVGKYTELPDAYISITESIMHGGIPNGAKVKVGLVNSEDVTRENAKELLGEFDAIVVPGGFGSRGIQGKIDTIEYARENNVPFLGICLGMQLATVEFARNVLGLKDANSTEFDKDTQNPIIDIMDDQVDITKKGGTMRLGKFPCKLKEGSKVASIYGSDFVEERHRHRYEFNNKYMDQFRENGFVPVGTSPDGELVEVLELKDHPWFVGVQFHPEFKSRPNRPHPLFADLIKAALTHKKDR